MQSETVAVRGYRNIAGEAGDRISAKLNVWAGEYEESPNGGTGKMRGFNRLIMMGRLTRDPQVKQLPSGTSVTDLALAVNETFKNRDGDLADRVCFVDVSVWDKQAEACGQYLKKGSPVLVEGCLTLDRWETPDGQKRSKHRVRAGRVQFLNDNRQNSASQGPVSVAASNGDGDYPF